MGDNKLRILVKPCQSGKTFVMLEDIVKMLTLNDDTIECAVNIIFCDNSLIQTIQTKHRIDTHDGFKKFKNENGELSITISSRSTTKTTDELPLKIMKGCRNLITCSNKTRVNATDEILKDLLTYMPHVRFHIWIDEIDKNCMLFKPVLSSWTSRDNVTGITFITATPRRPLKQFGEMRIITMPKTHGYNYHRFQDSIFHFYDDSRSDEYIDYVMETYTRLILPGTVWFVPAQSTKASHMAVKQKMLNRGMNCIVINSDGIQLYISNGRPIIIDVFGQNATSNIGDDISTILEKIHKRYRLGIHALAITGNVCISRGVTINSKRMMITHVILSPNIHSRDSAYQLAGRVCGNIKQFDGWKVPTIFCTKSTHSEIINVETKAIDLAANAYNEDRITVSSDDYKSGKLGRRNIEDRQFNSLDDAWVFIKNTFTNARRNKNNNPWVHVDGFMVSTVTYGKQKKKADLTADDRLSMARYRKVRNSHTFLTRGGWQAVKKNYIIIPVYKTLDNDDNVPAWYVRYVV